VQGRDFGPDDRPDTTPAAIVNRTFVKRYLAGRDPIGVQFAAGYPAPDPRFEFTVVGVVEDVRQEALAKEPQPAFYTAQSQNQIRRQSIVVSTSLADVAPLQSAIRTEVQRLDPQIAVEFQRATDIVAVRSGASNWA
jgi:hypothetical protein